MSKIYPNGRESPFALMPDQVAPLPGALASPTGQQQPSIVQIPEPVKDVEAGVASSDMAVSVGATAQVDEPQAPANIAKSLEVEEADPQYVKVTYFDILKQFSIMGWIAFGGPAAHIGLFQKASSLPTEQLPITSSVILLTSLSDYEVPCISGWGLSTDTPVKNCPRVVRCLERPLQLYLQLPVSDTACDALIVLGSTADVRGTPALDEQPSLHGAVFSWPVSAWPNLHSSFLCNGNRQERSMG